VTRVGYWVQLNCFRRRKERERERGEISVHTDCKITGSIAVAE
jgi:hypothetical protein